MLFATLALLDAGFDRWSIFDRYPLSVVNAVCFLPLLALLMAYDWWSTGKVQRVTLWAGGFLVGVQQLRHPRSHTAAWQAFATWAQLHTISFRYSPCQKVQRIELLAMHQVPWPGSRRSSG